MIDSARSNRFSEIHHGLQVPVSKDGNPVILGASLLRVSLPQPARWMGDIPLC